MGCFWSALHCGQSQFSYVFLGPSQSHHHAANYGLGTVAAIMTVVLVVILGVICFKRYVQVLNVRKPGSVISDIISSVISYEISYLIISEMVLTLIHSEKKCFCFKRINFNVITADGENVAAQI